MNERAHGVDPSLTFALSLVVSLVLWLSTFVGIMRGNVDIVDGGLRYLVALAISWAGVYGISALFTSYSRQHAAPEPPTPPALESPGRRRDDDPPASDLDEPETSAA